MTTMATNKKKIDNNIVLFRRLKRTANVQNPNVNYELLIVNYEL
jgi:hypothetical protein